MTRKRRGLFFFWDSVGIPVDIAINHLRTKQLVSDENIKYLIYEFIGDAWQAGWKNDKIKSDLREADRCGVLNLQAILPKLYDYSVRLDIGPDL